MVKRTYSQRDKPRPAYEHHHLLNYDDSHKRLKPDDLDELNLPTPPPSRGEKMSSLLKKGLKSFGGPISIPHEETDIASAPKSSNRRTIFDNVRKDRSQTANPRPQNIYGSREDFTESMKNMIKRKQKDSSPTDSHLPTPPAEVQKTALQKVYRSQVVSKANDLAVLPTTRIRSAFNASTETSQSSESVSQDRQPRSLYVPNAYTAEKTPAPHRSILGGRLSKRSRKAQM